MGSKEVLTTTPITKPGSKEIINNDGGGGGASGLDTDRSQVTEAVKRAHAKEPVAKELEKRYPKNGNATTSEEEKDEKGVKKQKKQEKIPVQPSETLAKIGKKDRLTQISCEEVGRVNRPIEDEPYYHGFLTRPEAEKLLKKNGEFLVRKTGVRHTLHYVLSVMHDNHVKNYLIRRTNKKRLYWVHKYAFKTVGDLVQYHYRNREPVCKEGYLLVKPCSKKEWQLNHEQVEQQHKLGEGAFGEVYRGSLQNSPFMPRVPVAIKTLQSGCLNADERIKFLNEANLMLNLHHPNVVKLYGVCTAKEPIMIVMELCQGGSLLSRVEDKEKPPTMDEKLNYVLGAAKGMSYLESRKIIHRDIAARNCLLGSKNEVKISDFGLSMLGNEFREKKMKNVPLRWLAPETLKKGQYSSRTDVYSFGVMIYEIYSAGREPYEGVENKELRKLILEQRITLEVLGEIQPEIEELRKRCLSYEPNKRPTFEELEMTIGEMPGAIHPPPPTFWSRFCQNLRKWMTRM